MARARLSAARAGVLAAALDLDLDSSGVCFACLSFVSMAIDGGDPNEVKHQLRCMTPDIWTDGLDETAMPAVRAACERRLPDAELGLADLEELQGRCALARAIVHRLAVELCEHARKTARVQRLARERSVLAPSEWN